MSIRNGEYSKTKEKVEHIMKERNINDKSLTNNMPTYCEGASELLINWMSNEITILKDYIKAVRPFCKDEVSMGVLDSFDDELAKIKKKIDEEMKGVLTKNPESDPSGYISEFFESRMPPLMLLQISLFRIRHTLDSIYDIIRKSKE
jgi:hypothetical protein